MKSERFEIKNRRGLRLVIQVDTPKSPKNLAFIAHGQGGFKEQKHIQAFAEAFLENNFRVVRFDATNSIGESGGKMIDVTTTNYLEDLEDVIKWARRQPWFQEPFALCGHSMGGMTITLYAQEYSDQVFALAPLATVVNEGLSVSTRDPEFMKKWQARGYFESPSGSRPGVIKKIGWSYQEDLKKHDLLEAAHKLTMPVLLVVGERDNGTPYDYQKKLLDAIPHQHRQLVKIKDADHNFRGPDNKYGEELAEVKQILSDWLKEVP